MINLKIDITKLDENRCWIKVGGGTCYAIIDSRTGEVKLSSDTLGAILEPIRTQIDAEVRRLLQPSLEEYFAAGKPFSFEVECGNGNWETRFLLCGSRYSCSNQIWMAFDGAGRATVDAASASTYSDRQVRNAKTGWVR